MTDNNYYNKDNTLNRNMVCNLNAIVLDWLASQTCDHPFVFPPEDEASHSRTITIQIRRHISIQCIFGEYLDKVE